MKLIDKDTGPVEAIAQYHLRNFLLLVGTLAAPWPTKTKRSSRVFSAIDENV